MLYVFLGLWAASIAAGVFLGKRHDRTEDGVGWTLVLGPVGLAIFAATLGRAKTTEGPRRTQPD